MLEEPAFILALLIASPTVLHESPEAAIKPSYHPPRLLRSKYGGARTCARDSSGTYRILSFGIAQCKRVDARAGVPGFIHKLCLAEETEKQNVGPAS